MKITFHDSTKSHSKVLINLSQIESFANGKYFMTISQRICYFKLSFTRGLKNHKINERCATNKRQPSMNSNSSSPAQQLGSGRWTLDDGWWIGKQRV